MRWIKFISLFAAGSILATDGRNDVAACVPGLKNKNQCTVLAYFPVWPDDEGGKVAAENCKKFAQLRDMHCVISGASAKCAGVLPNIPKAYCEYRGVRIDY